MTKTVTQDEPTQPRKRDGAGRELDKHGLPLSGPARIRALAGKPDPALAPPPPAAKTAAKEGTE
jgi:hypothetical protein